MPNRKEESHQLKPDGTYTYRELVAKTHLNHHTFKRWVREGMKGHRIGGKVRYLGADVMRNMIAEGTLEDPSELLVGNPVIPFHILEHVIERMAIRTAKLLEAKIDPSGSSSSPQNGRLANKLTKGVILSNVTYSADGFREALGVSRHTLLTLRIKGLPMHREGKFVVIVGEEFIQWAKSLPLAQKPTRRNRSAAGTNNSSETGGSDTP